MQMTGNTILITGGGSGTPPPGFVLNAARGPVGYLARGPVLQGRYLGFLLRCYSNPCIRAVLERLELVG